VRSGIDNARSGIDKTRNFQKLQKMVKANFVKKEGVKMIATIPVNFPFPFGQCRSQWKYLEISLTSKGGEGSGVAA
jgi:hypothetical protein